MKRSNKKIPSTKLKLNKYLEGYKITELGNIMNIPYTQLYKYKSAGANPTLLMIERLAIGLSRLRGKKVTVYDLLEVKRH